MLIKYSACFLYCVYILFLIQSIVNAQNCTTTPIEGARTRDGFCAFIYVDGLRNPRGIDVAPNGDLIVLDKGLQQILAIYEEDGQVQQLELLNTRGLNLNHAVKIHNGWLYASSSTTIYRWKYTPDEFRKPLTDMEIVVEHMPADGNHETRTLEFDSKGRLYVNIGSQFNIDADSTRARIVRFDLSQPDITFPLDYAADAEVFADGTRNEVGLRMDFRDRLWGVENGLDNLGVPGEENTRLDLGDIHVHHPAEEVNLFLEENRGKFYGYPFCWTEGLLDNETQKPTFPQGLGPLTQWATYTDTEFDDEWCRDPDNNIPPVFALDAHCAPLDILFYNGTKFPYLTRGRAAFVSLHGSWNRPWDNAIGRSVMILHLNEEGMPTSTSLLFGGPDATWKYRPVSLAVAPCSAYEECLFTTDDNSGTIIAIGYGGPPVDDDDPIPPNTIAPSPKDDIPTPTPVTSPSPQPISTPSAPPVHAPEPVSAAVKSYLPKCWLLVVVSFICLLVLKYSSSLCCVC